MILLVRDLDLCPNLDGAIRPHHVEMLGAHTKKDSVLVLGKGFLSQSVHRLRGRLRDIPDTKRVNIVVHTIAIPPIFRLVDEDNGGGVAPVE